jgi:hypothetical protein
MMYQFQLDFAIRWEKYGKKMVKLGYQRKAALRVFAWRLTRRA